MANFSPDQLSKEQVKLLEVIRAACKKIAPVWPLERFVAVNPYLGFTHRTFDNVAQELAIAGDIQMTLPSSFYKEKLEIGEISLEDIEQVLKQKNKNISASSFLNRLQEDQYEIPSAPTVNKLASVITDKDWSRFMVDRISSWASTYFDNGQASWNTANRDLNVFASWKLDSGIDKSPELSGLKHFRKNVKSLPDNPVKVIEYALNELDIPKEGIDLYLHSVLLTVGGWSAYAARIDWDNELYGGTDGVLIEFIAVLMSYELCLKKSITNAKLEDAWNEALKFYHLINTESELDLHINDKLILQEAFDVAHQRKLIDKFEKHEKLNAKKERALAQAVFCIDVRSEVFRRNLEAANSKIETIGFAGFFAFPIKYKPIGHQDGETQCPVLLQTGPTIKEELKDKEQHQKTLENRKLKRQIHQMWKYFKSGAVTCFSYVSPMGLSYLPKLITDSFGITRPVPHPDEVGLSKSSIKNKRVSLVAKSENGEDFGIPVKDQIGMAKNALSAMSLSEDFGKFVLITGHGASMVNNPHATGYDCGACGGHSGESNAKVAAAVLNNKEVREGLNEQGIQIPFDTTFLACLHDTTTDEVSIFNEYDVPQSQAALLKEVKNSLNKAGEATRIERAVRFADHNSKDPNNSIFYRSKDWAQLRPEWGLAGCSAFVVAPRTHTTGLDLEGKSFLHSYDWKKDKNFSILELIMTAPMVVTSWINLQYYGSTVDNLHFGSGNKTLHNVTAGVGVFEGYGGDLRVGLPMQSINDGENFQHEPLRLNVVIEAPILAINNILEKHESVRDLVDNGWIKLLAMNEGKITHSYNDALNWEEIDKAAA